jgi:hypothetical protein
VVADLVAVSGGFDLSACLRRSFCGAHQSQM